MIAFDAAIHFDSAAYTFDGLSLAASGLGLEVLFTEKKATRLTDPRYPGEVDPRGYMTGRLPDNKTFWL